MKPRLRVFHPVHSRVLESIADSRLPADEQQLVGALLALVFQQSGPPKITRKPMGLEIERGPVRIRATFSSRGKLVHLFQTSNDGVTRKDWSRLQNSRPLVRIEEAGDSSRILGAWQGHLYELVPDGSAAGKGPLVWRAYNAESSLQR